MTITDTKFDFVTHLFGKDRKVTVDVEVMDPVGTRSFAFRSAGRSHYNTEKRAHGRAYLFGEPEPTESIGLAQPPYGSKGENADNDAAWVAYNKEEVRIMRVILDKVAAEIDARFPEVGMARAKMTFDRHAGCSMCPCSPGFVVKGIRAEFRINIEAVEPVAADVEKAA